MEELELDPIAHRRRLARRLVVGPQDEQGISSVYVVLHHLAPALAGLPGVEVEQLAAELERHEQAAYRLEACKTDAELERVAAEIEQIEQRMADQLKQDLAGTPERAEAYVQRCQNIICASVVAIGIALEGQKPGPRPLGTHEQEVCRALTRGEDPLYLRRVTITHERQEGGLSILDYSVKETCLLATYIAGAFSTRPTVKVLPRSSGGAVVGGSAGDPLPGDAAEPVPAGPGPGGSGNRRSRRAGGKRGRSAGRQ